MSVTAVFGSKPALAGLRTHAWTTSDDAFEFADISPVHHAFPDVVRGTFDIAEIALVTFLQAFDAGRPVTLLPVTLLGRLQHHCLVTAKAPGELTPETLAGKRIGVRAWSQTTGVWVRGFLRDDLGVGVEDVDWVVYEDGHLPSVDPAYTRRSTTGNSLSVDFLDGSIDAAILGNELPKDPRSRTVLEQPAKDAAAWYGRTGAVPINHMAVVSDEFASGNSALAREIFEVLARSIPHPPLISSTPDLYPVGFDAIEPSLTLAARYAYEQGVISRLISADEVRAKTTEMLGDGLVMPPPTEG